MNEKETIGIFIVDDHQIVIDGLSALLEHQPQFRIKGTSTQPEQVCRQLQQSGVDILLTDVMMPGMTGQQLAKQVRQTFPDIKILALSMSGQGHIVDEMINDADINGYVLKNIDKEELGLAIRKIYNGGIYFSEEVLLELEKESSKKQEAIEVQLSPREIEIIKLIAKEMSNREIAAQLFISERTVETHRKNIFRKTNNQNVIGLMKYAYEHRLI
jgi:DNA-binding NarL/FixJ family response regulator